MAWTAKSKAYNSPSIRLNTFVRFYEAAVGRNDVDPHGPVLVLRVPEPEQGEAYPDRASPVDDHACLLVAIKR